MAIDASTVEVVRKRLADTRRRLFFAGLHPPQLRFIQDTAKRKAALCSRRAGKTYGVGADLVAEGLQRPHSMAYITLTRQNAKEILWTELTQWNARFELGIEFNISELNATFPTGAKLYLGGADNPREIEKWRGKKFSRVVVDEAGHFGSHIKPLINEVISPGLLDLDGVLYLTGTPNASCTGFFYDITTGRLPGWSVHRWGLQDNPHVPQTWLAEELARRGLTEDDPGIQREMFGRWVRSDSRLVYRYSAANYYDELPENQNWTYILGVDLGWWDSTAFVVSAYCEDRPELFILDQYKASKMTIDQVYGVIQKYDERYELERVVMDTGGLGKQIAESLNERGGLPKIDAAIKVDKLSHIAMLNGDLARGIVKVKRDSLLTREWNDLVYGDDGKENPTCENHISDACTYSHVFAKQYLHEPKIVGPVVSREVDRMDKFHDKVRAGIRKRQSGDDEYDQSTETILKRLGL